VGSIITIIATIFGVMIGSFLNALIHRIPRNINIALPRSACPSCGNTILWYHNIPILSFLYLRGKCAYCGAKISWQYPAVEALAGLFAFFIAPISLEPIDLFNFVFSSGSFAPF